MYLRYTSNSKVSVTVVVFFHKFQSQCCVFFHLQLKMAGKIYRFNNSRDVEDVQLMLLSCLSKYFCKCCEKYLCLEHSNIVCHDCYKRFAKPAIDDTDELLLKTFFGYIFYQCSCFCYLRTKNVILYVFIVLFNNF